MQGISNECGTPCYDVWEESPTMVHTSTLLSIVAGLKAIERYHKQEDRLENIMDFILEELTSDGRLKKSNAADESIRILSGHPILMDFLTAIHFMKKTARTVMNELYFDGASEVQKDTYFGGGSWILLSAYLAGHLKSNNERDISEEIKAWIERKADSKGFLPEQVPENLLEERMYAPWVEKWGEIASPLLWSHAAYIDMLL